MRKMLVALAVVLLWPSAAQGAPFSSVELGFTADFPAAPTVGQAEDSEKDDNGKVVSHAVTVSAMEQGVYMTAVVTDTFIEPMKIDVTGSLTLERDNFLKGLGAALSSANPGTLDGRPAMFFTYDRPDHSAAGSGIVVVIDTEKPRVYIVVTMHTPAANDGLMADLDRFWRSFHLQ